MIPYAIIPAITLLAGVAEAQPARPTHARAKLVAEHSALVPGTISWIGISFDIDEHWHIYWDGKGDSGQPVKAIFTVPPGYEVGQIEWPAPKRFVVADFVLDYVYEKRVLLLVPVKVPKDAKTGDNVTLSAKVTWMECSEECLPGKADVQLTLPVASPGDTPTKSSAAPMFEESRKRIPRPVEETAKAVKSDWSADTLTLTVPDAAGLSFYPHRTSVSLAKPLEQGVSKDSSLKMDLVPGSGERVIGILEVFRPTPAGAPPLSELYHINLPRTGSSKSPQPPSPSR